MASFGGEAFLPLTLFTIRGQSSIIVGVALTAATLSWTAGSWLQARLVAHQGRRFLVTTDLFLLALGLAGITSVLIPGISVLIASSLGSCWAWHGASLLDAQPRYPGDICC